jgi:hypothetical protein
LTKNTPASIGKLTRTSALGYRSAAIRTARRILCAWTDTSKQEAPSRIRIGTLTIADHFPHLSISPIRRLPEQAQDATQGGADTTHFEGRPASPFPCLASERLCASLIASSRRCLLQELRSYIGSMLLFLLRERLSPYPQSKDPGLQTRVFAIQTPPLTD